MFPWQCHVERFFNKVHFSEWWKSADWGRWIRSDGLLIADWRAANDDGGPSSCLALRHSTVGNNIIKTGRLCWFRGWLSSAALPNRKNGIPHSKPIGFIQSQCQWNQEKGGGVEEVSQPPQVKGHLNKSSQLNTFPDNVAPTPVFFLLLLPVSPTCGGSAPPPPSPLPRCQRFNATD